MAYVTLSKAHYIVEDRVPKLEITIDGQLTRIGQDTKKPLLDAGVVYLGRCKVSGKTIKWDNKSKFKFEHYVPDYGKTMKLKGFSDDPRLVRIVEQFYQDCESGAYKEKIGVDLEIPQ